jgi:hypothetical protein
MTFSREKILLLTLGGILVLWQGQSLFQRLILQPLDDRENRKTALEESIERKELEKRKQQVATARFKLLAGRSLPPDPVIAQSQYQVWLIEETAKARLTNVSIESVRADTRPKGNTYYTIQATIKARGTLERLCDFLHGFHQSGLLHRVNGLTLEAEKPSEKPELAIVINVEALALLNSPSRNSLLVDAEKPPHPDRPLRDRKEYESITAKNLFVATFDRSKKPARPKGESPVEQLPDTAEFVFLTASIAKGDRRDAMLFDRTTGKKTGLLPGEEFQVAGLSGKVDSIGNQFVILEIEGEKWRLELGENLRQMRRQQKVDPTAE